VEELAVNLAGRGHDVTVYARTNYTDKGRRKYKGVRLINLPTIPTKHLDAISHTFWACLDTLRRDFDIIHFHSIGPSSLLWLAKVLHPRTPVLATFHTQCYHHQKWGVLARWYLKLGEYICCRLADRVIVISQELADYTRNTYGIEPVVIPNGVAKQHRAEPDLITRKWGLSQDGYFLLVSRLIRHKGVHYAIQAFRRTKTDKKLVIVGEGFHTKSYVRYLQELAQGDERIVFTGTQTGQALQELFSNAYFFIQPSESEGLSIALLEAMAYGKTVLASDIAENREALDRLGVVFQSKNVDDLQDKIIYLLNNPEKVKAKGEAARIHVDINYNWDNLAASVAGLYNSLLHAKTEQQAKSRRSSL